eukprot:scaffold82398_cov58-Phaeocystis_antarctica.AAC.2
MQAECWRPSRGKKWGTFSAAPARAHAVAAAGPAGLVALLSPPATPRRLLARRLFLTNCTTARRAPAARVQLTAASDSRKDAPPRATAHAPERPLEDGPLAFAVARGRPLDQEGDQEGEQQARVALWVQEPEHDEVHTPLTPHSGAG